eukprot:GHVQ01023172.1.p1 GENE.GHVQ01023172.1~~GHVQ01023172.1.p1  ORF type:complete len:129 (+),score=9.66 GHVQ01023172.1:502-888(+)
MSGDRVMAEAVSSELPNYGVKVGLTNYPAAYCTGLLVARRLLKSVGMEKTITGVKETDGEEYHVEEAMGEDVERRPFKCLLDVGIVRTSRGEIDVAGIYAYRCYQISGFGYLELLFYVAVINSLLSVC